MFVLKAKELHKDWNGSVLFERISFEVRVGERLALHGRNGIGKTTLLHLLTGRTPSEGGSVQRMLPVEEWGWLDQQVTTNCSLPLLEYVQSASAELFELKQELSGLQLRMRMQSGGGNPEMEQVLERYADLYERYLQLDGYGWEAKVEKCLQQLSFMPSLWNHPFEQLSGGQKTKAQLAALMVREPKFVILDEPTNHLDEASLEWLEEWVRTYPGTILYVSHDRTFIDRTATAVLELEKEGCRRYAGGYTDYRTQKEIELRTQEALYKKQELEGEKLLESIRRYSQWFQQAHKGAGQNDFYRSKAKKNVSRLHAKEAALERLERDQVKKPREESQLKLRLDAESAAASTLLQFEEVSFAYEEGRELFRSLNLYVQRGDHLAVLGPNGAGKSTLLKLAAGALDPTSGSVRLHPQTRIGYFAQELGNLQMEMTILDSLLTLPGMTQTEARTILGCFLFSREDVFKTIGDLSMGEKCRVAFLKLYFGRANLLVLDEPTNYLDIQTREKVEEALQHYPGAVLLVSHDRYLIRKTANRLLLMEGQEHIALFPGSYDEYYSKARSRIRTPEEQTREDFREQLRLRLTQLITSEEPDDPDAKEVLMTQIRQLHRSIEEHGG